MSVPRSTSQCSAGSSLALSVNSTPETVPRDLVTPKAKLLDDALRPRLDSDPRRDGDRGGSCGMITAQLDISHFLAPLEARLSARMEAVEAALDRRCNALERRLNSLSGGGTGDGGGGDDIRRLVQALQERLAKMDERLVEVADRSLACSKEQASVTSNINEIWRQVRLDRQNVEHKFQNFSDAMEVRLRGLSEKLDAALAESVQTPVSEAPVERTEAPKAAGVVRWRSDGAAIRRTTSPAMDVMVQPLAPLAEDLGGAAAAGTSMHRFCASPPPGAQPRLARASSPTLCSPKSSLGAAGPGRPSMPEPRASGAAATMAAATAAGLAARSGAARPGAQSPTLASRGLGSPQLAHRGVALQPTVLAARQPVQRMLSAGVHEVGRPVPQSAWGAGRPWEALGRRSTGGQPAAGQ